MPKKPDLDGLLLKVKSIHADAQKSRTGITLAERNANRKSRTLDNLAAMGRQKIDETIKQVSEKAVTESANLRRTLKSESDEVTKLKNTTSKEYEKFSKTYSSAMNKKDGIGVKHNKISKLSTEAAGHVHQISKDHTKADRDAATIKELLKSSKEKDEALEQIYNQAQDVSDEISNTYGITLDTSLSGTLVERRNALKKRTSTWEFSYLASILFIVLAIVIALVVNRPENFIEVITERLVFVTPLVVISFVLSRQFSHERKLYEEYAFKAAAAQSLRGYTVLLNEQFKDVEGARKDVLSFTIDAMRDIYDREPLQQNPTLFHFTIGNHIAKIEAKIDERIEKKVPRIIGEVLHVAADEHPAPSKA